MDKIKNKIKSKLIDGNQLVGSPLDDSAYENNQLLKNCVDRINELPDSIDIKRIMKIKQQVESGTYDFNSKLGKVTTKLIEESQNQNPISFPLFDS